MRSCPACYVNSYPETPEITINEVNVNIDSARVRFVTEAFTTASAAFTAGANTIQLSYFPITAGAVGMALNSGVQGQAGSGSANNFSVSGSIVLLGFTPTSEDTMYFTYMAYDASATDDNDEVIGMMKSWAGTTAPSGWLLLDGVTSYTIADYPELYSFATTNGLILSFTTTNFVLKELKTVMQSGGAAVQVNTIIRH